VCDEVSGTPAAVEVCAEPPGEDSLTGAGRPMRRRGLLSGTAAGVIGVAAAVVIGAGVLVGGLRRSGRSAQG